MQSRLLNAEERGVRLEIMSDIPLWEYPIRKPSIASALPSSPA